MSREKRAKKVTKVIPVRAVNKDLRVTRASKALLVQKVNRVSEAILVLKVTKARTVATIS